MRVVFTKYHEEVTSVRKSVTQVKVETSHRSFEVAETPVVHRTSPTTSSRRFPVQQQEAIPALTARTNEVTDIVDLHSPSNKNTPSQVTYSMAGTMRVDPPCEHYVGEKILKSEDEFVRKQRQAPNEQMGDKPLLINEERFIRYDLTVHRFIATQEMTEHRRRTEKKLTVEIDV